LFEFILDSFSLNNISQPRWETFLTDYMQFFFYFTSLLFLGLLIWNIVLFVREKKKDSSSRRYLPRLLGFSFALLFSVVGLIFGLRWYIWFLNQNFLDLKEEV